MSMACKRRVLVVEDEALVAMDVESILREAGCEVVGPAASVDEALRLRCEGLDATVLDVNLGGTMSYQVADALVAATCPSCGLTGHSPSVLPQRHRDRPVVSKPYLDRVLLDVLSATAPAGPAAQA
jgi:CheY-like chemotaxis protein